MKYTKTIVLIYILYMVCGCNRKQQMDVSLPVINIVEGIEDEGTTMLLSEIAEDITFIPLETAGECLVGDIGSICFSNDYMVIIDDYVKQILLFDKTGKFIRKIGNKGRGPGEYLYPEFSVLVNDELFIWDAFLSTTFCYSLHTGKCLRTKKHAASNLQSMKYFRDSLLIYYYSCPESEDERNFFHIHTLSLDFENLNMFWQEEIRSNMKMEELEDCYAITCIKDGDFHVWDSNVENGTVSCLNKNFEISPIYRLYLGKYNNCKKKAGERYKVLNINETDRFLFIGGVLTEKRHARRILYDKVTGKSTNVLFELKGPDGGFHNDIDGSIPFWVKGYMSQNVLYDYITPERLKKLMTHPYYKTVELKDKEKHQAIKNYVDSAEEDANPVIFLITLKTK